MERYEIYCTAEQTKKALVLGAPIRLFWEDVKENYDMPYCEISPRENELGIMCDYAVIPTAGQMLGWMEEQCILVNVSATFLHNNTASYLYIIGFNFNNYSYNEVAYPSRKEATLAAIDAALDYLTN